MIALYSIGGLLALIALLLSSPVTVRFFYRDTPELILRVWGYPIRLLPRMQSKQATTASAKAVEPKEKNKWLSELQTTFEQDGIGAVLIWMEKLVSILNRAAGRSLRAVTVKRLRLEMRVSGADAAAVATNYGKVCAAFYPLLGVLATHIRIKKQDVDLRPDFLDEGGAVLVDITARISLWRLSGALIAAGASLLYLYIKTDDTSVDIKERKVNGNGRKQ